MKIKTAFFTIILFLVLSIYSSYAQELVPVETFDVVVTGRINVDFFSTVTLNPVTVEINQRSTVTIRILNSSGVGIPNRSVVIVAPGLVISQPTGLTDSTGRTTGTVYSTVPGTYTVCAKDITFGYDIYIQNCRTLYVVPVAVPTFLPEPYYTKGTTNTLLWQSLGTGYEYFIEISETSDFSSVIGNSGWTDKTSYQFTDLEDSKMYFYRVRARNLYGGVSSWSSTVFSVQDAVPPVIERLSISDIGQNNTVDWDPNFEVEMIFRVTDNLQLDSAIFLCVNSLGNTYTCVTNYYMEGDNLIVTIRLRDLERISNLYLREIYDFCVEARDAAGNMSRMCNNLLLIPKGEVEPTVPPIIRRIEKTVEEINEALDNTVGRLDPTDLERATTTASVVTVSTAVAISIGSLWSLPYLFFQFILNLLSWLGFRTGAKRLGYVYDALTKDPISQAIVRILNMENKMVWSDVTDPKGYFSARLREGKYKILVRASNYTFPSTIIFGREDYPLTNVYHGEDFHISEDTELNFSIPLDPREATKFQIWREVVWGRIKYIVTILHILLFLVGLILAIYLYSRNPYWLTLSVLLLYIPSFFLLIRNVFFKKDKYGIVKDTDGNPVEGVVIGLRETEFDRVIAKRVTDMFGRYRILVDSGRYYLELLDTGYKVEKIEGDSEILVEKDEYWVVSDITVSRIEKG